MKKDPTVVRVSVDDAWCANMDLVDLARRQCDHLGPHGFRAKKGQTNRSYSRRGFLKLKFPTRRLARAYVRRLERLGEPALVWR